MVFDEKTLAPYLLFDTPINYSNELVLYPVKMKNILDFQQGQIAITVRKDAIFRNKQIIKMTYFQFIKYACRNEELAEEYNMPLLPYYYDFLLSLFRLVFGESAEILYNSVTLDVTVNGAEITDDIFDDLRRIIIIQNDVDFDVDEFMNIDTYNALENAKEFENKKKKNEESSIEDYIDSVAISLGVTSEYVGNLTIRKFWRYVKRINKHEQYMAYQNASLSGFVDFKEELPHWMGSLTVDDKYKDYKTDEEELRNKVGSANG